MRADEVDFLISVSCTGYMIPSLDAYLVGDLGFRPNVRRLPITELGCVAGAMALSRDVPDLIRDQIGEVITSFLAQHQLTLEQLAACLLHPGGKKILNNLEAHLGITREKTAPSWDVLRDYGNLSSATLLFVLREWLTKRRPDVGAYGLMAGFGPGLSADLLLLRFV